MMVHLDLLSSLPSLVKITIFLGVWLIIWLPLAIPLALSLQWKPWEAFNPKQKLPLVALLYVFVPAMVGLTAKIEQKSWMEYGLPGNLSLVNSLLIGFSFALVSLILVFALQTFAGWIEWRSPNPFDLFKAILPILGIALWIGISEEIIFRGIFLTQLQQDYSPLLAALLSSLIFALVHLLWERQQTLPQLPGLWLMGIILVIARWLDQGNLGLAWGLHSGWVWGLTLLDSTQVIHYPSTTPQWITGINRQPLAGISGFLCLLLTVIMLWGYHGVNP